MKIFIKTFGCSANHADSEVMAGLLKKAGYKLVSSLEDCNLIIINSCGVKQRAEAEFFNEIEHAKTARKKIIATGCIPSGNKQLILKELKDISVVDISSITDIVRVVKETLAGEIMHVFGKTKSQKICLPRLRENKTIAIVPIAEGCLSNCNYCFTKLAKGNLFSYPKESILKEIRNSLKEGCREIWLTSQDNSAYGLDKATNIAKLLEKICAVKGDFFIRNGMSNPQWIKLFQKELIDVYKNPKVFKFLHIPIQSGSDKVLRDMERGYKVSDFKKVVSAFRRNIPEITIATDIICGYPTETEADWKKTLDLINWLEPDVINISQFWPRPGTEAAKLKQLPSEIKKKRSTDLTKLYSEIFSKKNRRWIGKISTAVVDEIGRKGDFVARNTSYKPIILKEKNLRLGQIVKVKITDERNKYLLGGLS